MSTSSNQNNKDFSLQPVNVRPVLTLNPSATLPKPNTLVELTGTLAEYITPTINQGPHPFKGMDTPATEPLKNFTSYQEVYGTHDSQEHTQDPGSTMEPPHRVAAQQSPDEGRGQNRRRVVVVSTQASSRRS